MDAAAERRQRRRQQVARFLATVGVSLQQLAGSTQKCLDEWARQVLLVQDQPSANWATVVLQLCRAVESDLANTLGQEEGLGFLAGSEPIGAKVRHLSQLDQKTKQGLTTRGVKIEFLVELQTLLSELARIRRETNAAHGGTKLRTATSVDADRARDITGKILNRLHADRTKRA